MGDEKGYISYTNDIITCPDSELDSPHPNKRFWMVMKGLKRESSVVAPLLLQGQYASDHTRKATVLNHQYVSVFTKENLANIPDKGPSPHPKMLELHNGERGVIKLLTHIFPQKHGDQMHYWHVY